MEKVAGGRPRGPEGKDVLLLAGEGARLSPGCRYRVQARAPVPYRIKGQRRTVRAPRRRVELVSIPFHHPPWPGISGPDREAAAPGHPDSRPIPVRREGDLAAIRRKRGPVLVAGPIRQPLGLSTVQRHGPHVVAAPPIRRKHDPGAVGRPVRLPVVEPAAGVLAQSAPIRAHAPDVVVPVPVGLEDDAAPVRRPGWLARIPHGVGQRRGGSSRGRHHPDAAQQVERERAFIRREGDGHIGPLREGDLDSIPGRVRGRHLGSRGSRNTAGMTDRGRDGDRPGQPARAGGTDGGSGRHAESANSRGGAVDESRRRRGRGIESSRHFVLPS